MDLVDADDRGVTPSHSPTDTHSLTAVDIGSDMNGRRQPSPFNHPSAAAGSGHLTTASVDVHNGTTMSSEPMIPVAAQNVGGASAAVGIWHMHTTEHGRPYYHNPITKVTQWEPPIHMHPTVQSIQSSNTYAAPQTVTPKKSTPAMGKLVTVRALAGHPNLSDTQKWHKLFYDGAKNGFGAFEAYPFDLIKDPVFLKKLLKEYRLQYIASICNPLPRGSSDAANCGGNTTTAVDTATECSTSVHDKLPVDSTATSSDQDEISPYVQHFVTQARSAKLLDATMITSSVGRDWWSLDQSVDFFKQTQQAAIEIGIPVVYRIALGTPLYSPSVSRDILKAVPTMKLDVDISEWGRSSNWCFGDQHWTSAVEGFEQYCEMLTVGFGNTNCQHPADIDANARAPFDKFITEIYEKMSAKPEVYVKFQQRSLALPFTEGRYPVFDQESANIWLLNYTYDLLYDGKPKHNEVYRPGKRSKLIGPSKVTHHKAQFEPNKH